MNTIENMKVMENNNPITRLQDLCESADVKNCFKVMTPEESKAMKIMRIACEISNITLNDLLDGSRKQPLPDIRKAVYMILKKRTRLSVCRLEILMNRKHAFYHHVQDRMKDAERFNPVLLDTFKRLDQLIPKEN